MVKNLIKTTSICSGFTTAQAPEARRSRKTCSQPLNNLIYFNIMASYSYYSDLFQDKPFKIRKFDKTSYDGATLLSNGNVIIHMDVIKHLQRCFKERYYKPGGIYETLIKNVWITKAPDYDLNEMEDGEII
jgi:hypothetical protein